MMGKRRFLQVTIIILGLSGTLFAQSTAPDGDRTAVTPPPREHAAASIDAFRGIAIGMPIASVKERLQKDPSFNYRGDPDVSFLPGKDQVLIECTGNAYIRRAYFQFVDEKLFTMILDLDEGKVDYFSVMTTLQNKYGPYLSFTPRTVIWEIGGVRLALEKPLTVKYVDLAVLQRLKEAGKATETQEEKSLDEFLKSF